MNNYAHEAVSSIEYFNSTVDIEDRINKFFATYFKSIGGVFVGILIMVVLLFFYVLLCLIALPVRAYLEYKTYTMKSEINILKDPVTYKILRKRYHFNDIEIKFKVKKYSILYYIIYPINFMFKPASDFHKNIKKQIKSLDDLNNEKGLFIPIKEKELWKRRVPVYEYKI